MNWKERYQRVNDYPHECPDCAGEGCYECHGTGFGRCPYCGEPDPCLHDVGDTGDKGCMECHLMHWAYVHQHIAVAPPI
jgi:hypothetical protein